MNPNKDNSTIRKPLKAFSKYSEQEQENILLALSTLSPLLLDLQQNFKHAKSDKINSDTETHRWLKRVSTSDNLEDQTQPHSLDEFEKQKERYREEFECELEEKREFQNHRQPKEDIGITKTQKKSIRGYRVKITKADIDPKAHAEKLKRVMKIFRK